MIKTFAQGFSSNLNDSLVVKFHLNHRLIMLLVGIVLFFLSSFTYAMADITVDTPAIGQAVEFPLAIHATSTGCRGQNAVSFGYKVDNSSTLFLTEAKTSIDASNPTVPPGPHILHFTSWVGSGPCPVIDVPITIVAGPSSGPPPPQAILAGDTHLDFYDDFNYTDTSFIAFKGTAGKTWSAALWYKPGAANPENFSVENSVLTIRNNTISTLQNSPPYTGHTWRGGYFEARMYCHGFCSFFLGSQKWAQLSGMACGVSFCPADLIAGEQMDTEFNGVNEMDITETYASNPTLGQFTVHKSGMGAGQQGFGTPDVTNPNTHVRLKFSMEDSWHIYGLLWTKDNLYWYIDNQLVDTAPTFQSTWQPAFLILMSAEDKYLKQPDPNPVTLVDWVKVWQPRFKGPGIDPLPSPNISDR